MFIAHKHPELAQKYMPKEAPLDPILVTFAKKIIKFSTLFSPKKEEEASFSQTLVHFYHHLKNSEYLLSDLSKAEESSQLERLVLEIVQALANLLFHEWNVSKPKNVTSHNELNAHLYLRLLQILKVVKLFAVLNQGVARFLSNLDGFFILLTEMLLCHKEIFKVVLCIMEALITLNPNIIKPENFPQLKQVFDNMSLKQLARFSRVMAHFFLETTEKLEFKELLNNYSVSRMVDVHAFLLTTGNILENYVQILDNLKEIMYALLKVTQLQDLQQTLKNLTERNLIKRSGLSMKFWKTLIGLNTISAELANEIFKPKFIVNFLIKKSNITEILFIITNFLAGKRKNNVQARLNTVNFIEQIFSPLFSFFFHPQIEIDTPEDIDPLHGEDCHCNNPLAAARIQLLRVFTNYCDTDSERLCVENNLITPSEQDYIRALMNQIIYVHHYDHENLAMREPLELIPHLDYLSPLPLRENSQSVYQESYFAHNYFENATSYGILHRIIILLQKIKPDSSFRFLLASCVESFLRGCSAHLQVYQLFVAHTGLMHTLVNQIICKSATKLNNIQISYDMLGQIVKCNKSNLIMLEGICAHYSWHHSLFDCITLNIIDSNVFLRSLLLSFEQFNYQKKKQSNERGKQAIDQFTQQTLLYQGVKKRDYEIFNLLARAVNIDTINQDNICCINTMLIILTFCQDGNAFDNYFEDLFQRIPSNGRIKFFKELKQLLKIWQRYYMSKRKDSYGLECTTNIPFYFYIKIKDQVLLKIKELKKRALYI